MKDDVINRFIEYSKIPHPSQYSKKIIEYLKQYCLLQGYDCHVDQYDNLYFDVEASEANKNKPSLILQAHTDMVCVAEDHSYDFKMRGIDVLVDGNKMHANKTSLGADNGLGLCMILTLLEKCKNHGRIRVLLTSDEEIGLVGASKLNPEVLQGFKYLINTDFETANTICYGNAGNTRLEIIKTIDRSDDYSNKSFINISLDGLIGGHSGMDINKNRLNAVKVLFDLLKSIRLEGIETYLCQANIGCALNSIPFNGNLSFAILSNHLDEVIKIINNYFALLQNHYLDEKISYKINEIDKIAYLSINDSDDLINLVTSLPLGALSFINDVVETSLNIGILTIDDKQIKIGVSLRSCNNNSSRELENSLKNIVSLYKYDYQEINAYPGYISSLDTSLLKVTQEAFRKVSNIEPNLTTIHAGFECSWFYKHNPNLMMVAIGPTIHNPHSINEYVEIDTIEPTMKVLQYIIQNIE